MCQHVTEGCLSEAELLVREPHSSRHTEAEIKLEIKTEIEAEKQVEFEGQSTVKVTYIGLCGVFSANPRSTNFLPLAVYRIEVA